ncbi:hypothetical protein Pelo_17845 [Pelomyxa schiedti]|nr:hypothetical protein Pelo_17845 [Pelomyxa schiedti]
MSSHATAEWKLSPNDKKYLRSLIINLVLATDMAQHFEVISKFKEKALGVPLSPFTDRSEGLTKLSKLQTNFINIVAEPLLATFDAACPAPAMVQCIKANNDYWASNQPHRIISPLSDGHHIVIVIAAGAAPAPTPAPPTSHAHTAASSLPPPRRPPRRHRRITWSPTPSSVTSPFFSHSSVYKSSLTAICRVRSRISAYDRGTGIDFEVKCIGKGHPGLFSNQSYILKALFNFQENGGAGYIEVEPHPNIARYFCRFQDTIPLEFYDPLPASAKEMVMMCDPHVLDGGTKSHLLTWIVLEHHPDTLRNFLLRTAAPLAYTTTTETAATTPWSIVHKYSRDISAALVHLFNNKVIHFNLTLDTIAVSSNASKFK